MPIAVQDYRTSRVRLRSVTSGDPTLRAIYLELLFALWERGGRIPADPESVADEVGLPVSEVAPRLAILAKLGEKGRGGIVIADGWITNARVTEDLERAIAYRERQSDRGRKSGEVRRERRLSHGSVPVEPSFPSPTPLPSPTPTPEPKETKGHAELTWRIERTWQRFLSARSRFYQERGTNGGPDPKLAADLRELIRTAIVEYDKGLLSASDRERWESDSYAAAAGEGLFLDPWMTGRDPENRKLFLESWRPWKPQKGKGHPVPRFAQLAFDARARVEPEASAVPTATPLADAPKWRAIRSRLAESITPDELRTWIDPLVPVEETDQSVTLAAPNGRMAYAAGENYGEAMTRAALAAFGAPFDVKVTAANVRRTA